MHVRLGHCRAARLRRPLRESVLLAKAYVTKAIEKGFAIGKGPARSTISTASTRNRRRAASTKFRNTACTPPPNPAPTESLGVGTTDSHG